MAVYAIGDVQGCYQELMLLLDKINFDMASDQLWLTGDLVNRGPASLKVLRFVKSLGKNAVTVLGNHDLHYLAVSAGVKSLGKQDTFQDVLNAPDQQEIFDWLRCQPILHFDPEQNFLLVHAGIAPQWDKTMALNLAEEVHLQLRSGNPEIFLQNMYGDLPVYWSDNLADMERLRVITNFFTRVRYIDAQGGLKLDYKAADHDKVPGFRPWFLSISQRIKSPIIFGHWAALKGKTERPLIFALDTGCCWGNKLTALRLSDLKIFNVNCTSNWGINDD